MITPARGTGDARRGAMAGVIDVRLKALQRQIMTLERFATSPAGVFETLDQMVKNFRMANRETLAMLTGKAPAAKGQLLRNLARRRPRLILK